jgi:hypothetical protein
MGVGVMLGVPKGKESAYCSWVGGRTDVIVGRAEGFLRKRKRNRKGKLEVPVKARGQQQPKILEFIDHGPFVSSEPATTAENKRVMATINKAIRSGVMAAELSERGGVEGCIQLIRKIQIWGKIRGVLGRVHVGKVLY